MIGPCCGCQFWKGGAFDSLAACRRFPPHPSDDGDPRYYGTSRFRVFPMTMPKDGCGEFQPVPEAQHGLESA